uniref:Uncharacterized protein n=1 Tax=Arundo donax TaxID=35708 RepID=A0A0A9FHZ8_ARUDO
MLSWLDQVVKKICLVQPNFELLLCVDAYKLVNL